MDDGDVQLAIRILRSMLQGAAPAQAKIPRANGEKVDSQFMREVFRSIDELRASSEKSRSYLAMLEAKYGDGKK